MGYPTGRFNSEALPRSWSTRHPRSSLRHQATAPAPRDVVPGRAFLTTGDPQSPWDTMGFTTQIEGYWATPKLYHLKVETAESVETQFCSFVASSSIFEKSIAETWELTDWTPSKIDLNHESLPFTKVHFSFRF